MEVDEGNTKQAFRMGVSHVVWCLCLTSFLLCYWKLVSLQPLTSNGVREFITPGYHFIMDFFFLKNISIHQNSHRF